MTDIVSKSGTSIAVRKAAPVDLAGIREMLAEHAAHHRLTDEMCASATDLAGAFFAETPRVFCYVAENDGQIVGFLVWFYTFSTFLGRVGIHIEDLYVRPEARRGAVSRALTRELARKCAEENIGRLEWVGLEWNRAPTVMALALDATAMEGWKLWRSSGDTLRRHYNI